MCEYENILYGCAHIRKRLIKYCHFARNDPFHQCFGSWRVRREWANPRENCPVCVSIGVSLVVEQHAHPYEQPHEEK